MTERKKRTKASNHARQSGELKRYVVCNFCGQLHRHHGKDAKECRDRRGKSQDPMTALPQPTSQQQRKQGDVLKGDQNAHTIARKLRQGWSPRHIAKHMGVSIDVVRDVMAKTRKT